MPVFVGLVLTLAHALGPTAWPDPRPAPAAQGVWPLHPRPSIAEGFDPPRSRWGAGHRGVDLFGRSGQSVHTSLPGEVVFAGRLAGRGVVVVRHGPLRTTYEPVHATVSVGQVLTRGARIGTLQRGMSHCFPRACLHWGLIRGRTYLDPLALVGLGPIRLLPLSGRSSGSGWGVPGRTSSDYAGALRQPPTSTAPVRRVGGPGGRPGVAVPR